jgi:peroxiredoxin
LVKAELFPEGLVGKIAPAFTAADREGKKFSLKELKGKYTIIDFWASWCVPCRKEIPNMKKLYAKYNSKGLVIISVSLDKEDAKWKKALDEEQLSWPNLIDKDGISDKYSIKTIPAMFVVDKNGKVIGEKLRGESLPDKLKELFGE